MVKCKVPHYTFSQSQQDAEVVVTTTVRKSKFDNIIHISSQSDVKLKVKGFTTTQEILYNQPVNMQNKTFQRQVYKTGKDSKNQ